MKNQEEEVQTNETIIEKKGKFLNPFDKGVSYKDFLKEVEKSKKTVAEYCKGKLTEKEITWLENELSIIKK